MCAGSDVSRLFLLFVVFPLVVLTGCRGDAARQYELRGQVLAIRPAAREVLIKHGDIQNFMPGMTMPFKVRDARLLESKTPGDLVTAQLMVARTEAWIAAIEKTGHAPLEAPAAMPAAAFVTPLTPGDAVPEATLQDQDGRPLSLTGWRGQAVAITFIYLRCPLPNFCPLMDRRFAEVQKTLQLTPDIARRVKLLSVSFDPDRDTPAALKAHAARLAADETHWRFATAPAATVDRFAATFGVNVIREADKTITHNLRTAVIDPQGKVATVYSGSDWTADQIVRDLTRALSVS
jgi:protein SCO1